AGRGARADPRRRRLRDGGEPPVAARHPRALPALRALQVGVEDRELPRAVHRLEHGAQPLHQAPARQPRERRAGAPRLRACARAGQLTMDLRGAAVAVTGATGFLGRYRVDVLLARGAHVIGVVRNPGRVPELAARGVELRLADLAERDRLARGFAGAQAVVSNAALFSLRNRSWEDHHRANIQGTENVFGALADAGVKRVVHVSS